MLFIILLRVVTMFSNFQATVPLISCEYTQNSEKYDKTFGTKIRVGLKKKGG